MDILSKFVSLYVSCHQFIPSITMCNFALVVGPVNYPVIGPGIVPVIVSFTGPVIGHVNVPASVPIIGPFISHVICPWVGPNVCLSL